MKINLHYKLLPVVLFIAFAWQNAFAEQTEAQPSSNQAKTISFSSTAPISVEADELNILEKGKKSIYTGNVIIQQDYLKITAEQVEIINQKSSDELQSLKAQGTNQKPAILSSSNPQDDIFAEAQQIDYQIASGWLVLKGNPAKIIRSDNTIKGQTVRYNLKTEEITASGNKKRRAKLIITPKDKQDKNKQD